MKDIVKKNMVSIICGVIALIAIGALFWPVSGYYDELQQSADARLAEYKAINGLLPENKPRKLPVTDLRGTAEAAKDLGQFPTAQIIAAWTAVTDRIKADSDKIYSMALEMNRNGHQPVFPNALPAGSTGQLNEFRQRYAGLMDFLTPDSRKKSLLAEVNLRAGSPPTNKEIEAAKAKIDKDEEPRKLTFQPDAFKTMVDRQKNEVQENLRRKAADECNIYMQFEGTTLSLLPYEKVRVQGNVLDHTSVFMAQMILWVQEDVLRALASANKDTSKVADSPVKHLISLRIVDKSLEHFLPQNSATPVAAPTTAPSQTLEKKPVSLSQRTSNGLYDVIRFNLRLVVDAEKVPLVLQELGRNQFISVNNVILQAVDSAQMQSLGYYYGEKPVVFLDMACEELMFRENTTKFMPASVKQALGFVETPAAPPAQ